MKSKDSVGVVTFAKRLNVTAMQVRRALKQGHIFLNKNDELDFEEQKKNFINNVNPAKDTATGGENAPTFMAARIRKESAAAQLKEIELARARGKYLEKDAVREAVYAWAHAMRDNLLAIPERVAADVAAQLFALTKSGKLTEAETERLVRAAWAKESREALAALDKKPNIKNKDTKHDEGAGNGKG
jgi:hypothetical protein